jgi:DNA invertase Pin-like site-specific DNA recombinase
MKNQEVVAYYRRSQDKKGQRHSINAQKDSVRAFCASEGLTIVSEHQDTQSGKDDNRAGLLSAVSEAKAKNIPLVVLRVDRLGRKLSTLAALFEDSNLKIIISELGMEADFLTVSILCSVAAAETKRLSQRTKEGLAAARKRGVVLGNPKLSTTALPKAIEATRAAGKETRERFSKIIVSLRESGLSYGKVALQLTSMGIPSPRGKAWNAMSVMRIYKASV